MRTVSVNLVLLFLLLATTSGLVAQRNLLKNRHSFMLTGDILLGVNYPTSDNLPMDNGEMLFSNVRGILSDADVTLGNLEGCFLDDGVETKHCKDSTSCYIFSMPESYAKLLNEAGYDVMSIANNHIRDFLERGQRRTQDVLEDVGVMYAGIVGECESVVFEKDGFRYGFCAFAPNVGTVNINDLEGAKAIILELDRTCDIVIASFHGGAEGVVHNRVMDKMETFYGEKRGNVYQFARICVDAGADVVFGHGPHVPRAVDLYKDRFIAYSLGNFCTAGPVSIEGESGYAPMIKVVTDGDGKFIEGKIYSALQLDKTGPVLDVDNLSVIEIRRLTLLDFPKSRLVISDDGYIGQHENKE